ncbi:MAG: PDZ domain-containing protein [Oceanospirillales bacterium]|nr:PDZ domain-containing protein [Oceanospirillales bacterium]
MKGFIIQSFTDESPARNAGLQIGDIIIKFGNVDASTVKIISSEVTIPKDGLNITYLRNNKESTCRVTGSRFGMVAEDYQVPDKKTVTTPKADDALIITIDAPEAGIIEYPIKTSYGAGRALASLSIFFGWAFIILGAFLLVFSIVNEDMHLMMILSIIVLLAGWFGVQQSQLILAITDTADSQRQATNMLYTMLLEERRLK